MDREEEIYISSNEKQLYTEDENSLEDFQQFVQYYNIDDNDEDEPQELNFSD